jgi:CRP-like cAMP-binding protein
MVGAHLALGVMRSPMHALVQGPGTGWRVGRRSFCTHLAASPALRRDTGRYLYVLMAQLASSAGCLRFHPISARLARWLLMSQDRARSDSFRVTHQFLAYMLGVRRVSITEAAGVLQRGGLIEYHRGALTVLDRRGLKASACTCYAAHQRIHADLLG